MPKSFLLQDTFFYSLVYDPNQKTLLADKGEIRVGSKYQSEANKVELLKEGWFVMCAIILAYIVQNLVAM